MGTNAHGQQDRCPQCGGELRPVHPLGNALKALRFISCTDPRCDYVLVEEVLPPPSIGLPVDYSEVLTLIENERREAENNRVRLPAGKRRDTLKGGRDGGAFHIIALSLRARPFLKEGRGL